MLVCMCFLSVMCKMQQTVCVLLNWLYDNVNAICFPLFSVNLYVQILHSEMTILFMKRLYKSHYFQYTLYLLQLCYYVMSFTSKMLFSCLLCVFLLFILFLMYCTFNTGSQNSVMVLSCSFILIK